MNTLFQLRNALATTLHVKEDSLFLNELFQHYVTTQELLNAEETELSQVKGIGKVRAKQIAGSLKLARMINQVNVATEYIRSPADAYQLLRYEIGHIDHEEVWILFLDTKNGVIAKHRHTIGSLNSCIVSPREILRKAILRNSCSMIMAHNHPSQHPLNIVS